MWTVHTFGEGMSFGEIAFFFISTAEAFFGETNDFSESEMNNSVLHSEELFNLTT